VLLTGRPFRTENYLEDPRIGPDFVATAREEGIVAGMVAPIRSDGRIEGLLYVHDRVARPYTDRDEALLLQLADHAAAALSNARTFAESERRRRVAESLVETGRLISKSLDTGEVGRRIVDSLTALFEARVAGLYRLDSASGDLISVAVGGDVGESAGDTVVFPRGSSAVGFAVAHGRPVVTPDVLSDRRFTFTDEVRARIERSAYRSGLALPLVIQGRVIGALAVGDRAGRVFDADAVRVAQAFADQAALALENARLYQESLEQRRSLATLVELTQRLTRGLDLDSVLGSIAAAAAELFRGEAGFRLVGGDFLVRVGATEGALGAMARERIRLGETFSGQVALTGQAVVSEDTSTDLRRLADHQAALAPGRAGALLCVPIRLGGQILGTLNVYRERGFSFDGEAVRLATSFADQAAIAIENARLYQAVKQAYEELSRTQEQLVRGETLRALGELASGAAHHMNNLLAVVVGRVQILQLKADSEPLRRALTIIERAALDGAEVVRRIQKFARVPLVEELASVDLNCLVAEVVELTRGRWQGAMVARGLQLQVNSELRDIPRVRGNEAELREAVTNLLINAIEACPAGGRISLSTGTDERGVVFVIEDTGIGMPEDVVRQALEPFFTTKGLKSTGLGLSVTHGIVRRHGGKLKIDSRPGEGTRVTIRVPIGSETTDVAPFPAPPSPARMRVLVVDDQLEVREVVADLLDVDGHVAWQAAGGADALAILEGGTVPDLVLTDLGMAGMTGWKVAAAIKARWPTVTVGLMTGWGDAVEAAPEERAAVDFILPKPVTRDALRAALAVRR
jgi:GAF domain-containing protein/CheY-like chemotaxis protein/anti-sigma regulatory factor (Ser/Thr protein kinase)